MKHRQDIDVLWKEQIEVLGKAFSLQVDATCDSAACGKGALGQRGLEGWIDRISRALFVLDHLDRHRGVIPEPLVHLNETEKTPYQAATQCISKPPLRKPWLTGVKK